MSAQKELSELKERYRRAATEDLLRVIHSSQDYRPEAVELAREVLVTRDLSQEGITVDAVVSQLEEESAAKQQLAEEPLGVGLKIVCFLFCGLPGILFATYQGATGRSQRAREAWSWVGYGWLARAMLFLMLYFGSA